MPFDQPAIIQPMTHKWFLYPRKNGRSFWACKRCGIVQNDENKNADNCKGNVSVGTRKPDQHDEE